MSARQRSAAVTFALATGLSMCSSIVLSATVSGQSPAPAGTSAEKPTAPTPPVVLRMRSVDWLHGVKCVDIDGDRAVDVVAQVECNGRRLLRIYRQQDGALPDTPSQIVDVPRDAVFWLFGEFGTRGRALVFIGGAGIAIHPVTDGAVAPNRASNPASVHDVDVFPPFAHQRVCFHWPIARDLDRDGRTDIVLPVDGGFRVAYQREPGEFSLGAHLRCTPTREALGGRTSGGYTAGTRTSLPRPTIGDVDGDGLDDIMLIDGDRLLAFRGTEHGIDAERPIDRVLPLGGARDGLEWTRLNVADLDGDGALDLVRMVKHGALGLFDSLRTRIAVYLGPLSETRRPAQIIRVRGLSRRPHLGDLDGDGDTDMVLTTLELDALAAVRQLLGDGVPTPVTRFTFDRERRRFREPEVVCERALSFGGLLSHRPVALAYLGGDFDGDRRADFLSAEGDRTLIARKGGPEGTVLFRVDAAYSPDRLVIADVDGDRRADVITHDGHEVTVILCR